MQKRFISFLLTLTIAFFASKCYAVVVFVKDSDQPVMGFFVRQDDTALTIQVPLPSGQRRERVIINSQIDDVLFTVDFDRLKKLDPAEPKDYRDYAEELTEKREDPEARETSIRLYVIAASHDDDKLGRSSLLGLINLSRNDEEESRFRAMAYLLDPEHNERVLVRPDPVKRKPDSIDKETRIGLLNAVGSLRRGKKYSANQALQSPAVRSAFEYFEDLMTLKEFEAAMARSEMTPSMLRKLILLELALLPNAGEIDRPMIEPDTKSWIDAIRRDGVAPIPPLSLNRLTEFDPANCFYRNGKWVEESE